MKKVILLTLLAVGVYLWSATPGERVVTGVVVGLHEADRPDYRNIDLQDWDSELHHFSCSPKTGVWHLNSYDVIEVHYVQNPVMGGRGDCLRLLRYEEPPPAPPEGDRGSEGLSEARHG